ncbi:MAG: MaoC family dehydratase N-terminal domain-containing protein [Deltaproteobacteria bacterium]|nr:MaoC family dehydratase N-terminal domain-containing protein [Deltaproteobacteria bacterium]
MSSRASGKKTAPKAKASHKAAKMKAPKMAKLKKPMKAKAPKAVKKAKPAPKAMKPAHKAMGAKSHPPKPRSHGHSAKAMREPISKPPPPMVAKRPPLPPPLPSKPPPPKIPTFARSYYWADLRVGDDLPPLAKPAIDRVQIVKYAGASGDLNRLHVDEPFAHSLGFRGAFTPGPLMLGFMGQLLSSWLKKGQVRRLSGRFVKLVWPGDELTCRGRIAELKKDKGICTAEIELWAENQKGELVLRGHSTCELVEAPPPGTGGFLASLDARMGRPLPGRAPLLPPRRR